MEGVFVDFFGRLAHTPVGAARLAVKYRIPILIGFIWRARTGRFVLDLKTRILPETEDEHQLTSVLTGYIERQIRNHPTQWVWVHRRWKKRHGEENEKREAQHV